MRLGTIIISKKKTNSQNFINKYIRLTANSKGEITVNSTQFLNGHNAIKAFSDHLMLSRVSLDQYPKIFIINTESFLSSFSLAPSPFLLSSCHLQNIDTFMHSTTYTCL